jgi:hypothetical protein
VVTLQRKVEILDVVSADPVMKGRKMSSVTSMQTLGGFNLVQD